MRRREFVTLAGATLCRTVTAAGPMDMAHEPSAAGGPADPPLPIAPTALEVAPSHFVSTIAYNGTAPGPLLRLREGRPVTIDVVNETDAAELVHWHGLFLPAEIDGAEEEGTVPIP